MSLFIGKTTHFKIKYNTKIDSESSSPLYLKIVRLAFDRKKDFVIYTGKCLYDKTYNQQSNLMNIVLQAVLCVSLSKIFLLAPLFSTSIKKKGVTHSVTGVPCYNTETFIQKIQHSTRLFLME